MASTKPLREYVYARVVKPEAKTASGLYLPEKAIEKGNKAVVKAVGKGVKGIKVNDVIIYKTYSTVDVKSGSDEFVFVKEEDIVGVE